MTHNFKPGDKITMRVGARSMYGTHLGGMKGAVRYATGYGAYPLGVTFEVTKNNKENYVTQTPVFLGQKPSDWDDLFIYLKPEGRGGHRSRNIKSWKYVDAPANIVEIDGYFIVRDQDEVKVYDNKTTAEAHKYWGGLVHVTSVKHGYEKIAKYAQRDATYQRYIPALLAAIKFIEGGN